jgi:hypothetical protein
VVFLDLGGTPSFPPVALQVLSYEVLQERATLQGPQGEENSHREDEVLAHDSHPSRYFGAMDSPRWVGHNRTERITNPAPNDSALLDDCA